MKTLLLALAAALIVAAVWMLTSQVPDDGTSNGSSQSSLSAGSSRGTASSAASVQNSTPKPQRETACTDGRDNESDGLADCDDPDCAGDLSCRCSALSCGNPATPGSTRTCLPENGCVCNEQNGCMACRGEDQICGSNADCCQGMSLTCQATIEGGAQVKRCLPVNARVCDISCMRGVWGEPENCAGAVPPPGTEDCETLTGACTAEGRNPVKCRES